MGSVTTDDVVGNTKPFKGGTWRWTERREEKGREDGLKERREARSEKRRSE